MSHLSVLVTGFVNLWSVDVFIGSDHTAFALKHLFRCDNTDKSFNWDGFDSICRKMDQAKAVKLVSSCD
jgi:hypothetical protein